MCKVLKIHADDYGYSENISQNILDCYKNGIINSLSVMIDTSDKLINKYADDIIYIPEIEEELTPFLTVIPMQLLSYHIAKKRGCKIDKPRKRPNNNPL